MIKSEQINELAAALAKAQSEMTSANKDSKAHAYKYADLGSVIDAVKPALNKNGISFAQLIEESDPNTVRVTTLLIHSSGQYLGSTGSTGIPEMRGCNDAQRAGAAQSYLKRYQLQALAGLPTEDNDASSEGFAKTEKKAFNHSANTTTEAKEAVAPAKKGFGVKSDKPKTETVSSGSEDSWS